MKNNKVKEVVGGMFSEKKNSSYDTALYYIEWKEGTKKEKMIDLVNRLKHVVILSCN